MKIDNKHGWPVIMSMFGWRDDSVGTARATFRSITVWAHTDNTERTVYAHREEKHDT